MSLSPPTALAEEVKSCSSRKAKMTRTFSVRSIRFLLHLRGSKALARGEGTREVPAQTATGSFHKFEILFLQGPGTKVLLHSVTHAHLNQRCRVRATSQAPHHTQHVLQAGPRWTYCKKHRAVNKESERVQCSVVVGSLALLWL